MTTRLPRSAAARCTRLLALSILLASPILGTSSLAHAESLRGGTSDSVTTRTGAFYRGTIVENIPGDHVTILLANGESRTIAAKEVTSVHDGDAEPQAPTTPPPAPGAPAAPQPIVMTLGIGDTTPKTSHGPPALMRFTSDAPGLTVYRRMDDGFLGGSTSITTNGSSQTGAVSIGRFTPICTTPCALEVPTGTVALGVGTGSRPAIPADEILSLTGPTTVHASVDEYAGTRSALSTTWLLGILGGGAGLAAGLVMHQSDDPGFSARTGVIVGSSVLIGVGFVALLATAMFHDEAHVRVVESQQAKR